MAINLFDQILADGLRKGQIPGRTQQARDWFRNTALKFSNIKEGNLLASGAALTTIVNPGNMYMFVYDPKLKQTLPYYDNFPLIFPISKQPDGFIGINLHYLPPVLRAKLMDMLYQFVTDPTMSEKTKLKITYNILQASAANKYIKPCIKKYLNSHVKSRFIFVEPAEWDICLFLPLQRFQKKTAQEVWKESTQMVNSRVDNN